MPFEKSWKGFLRGRIEKSQPVGGFHKKFHSCSVHLWSLPTHSDIRTHEKSHPKRRKFLFTFCFQNEMRGNKRARGEQIESGTSATASAAKKAQWWTQKQVSRSHLSAPVNSLTILILELNVNSFFLSFLCLRLFLLSSSPNVEMDFFLFTSLFRWERTSKIGDWETQEKNVIKRNSFFATFFFSLKDSLLSLPYLLAFLLRITSASKRISIKNSRELLFLWTKQRENVFSFWQVSFISSGCSRWKQKQWKF